MSDIKKFVRLVLTVDEAKKDHNKWLEVRNRGLGGSDAGVILNLNPWKDRYTLWAEKTGKIPPVDLSDNEKVHWGTKLEPVVAQEFEEREHKKVRKMGTVQSLLYPFMYANVDRMVVGEDAGLEIKTTDANEAYQWENGQIPNSYYCQCLHYLAVLPNIKKWYIAVLIGGNKYKCTYITRSDEEVNYLIEKEREFWEYVKNGVEPPVNDSKTCTDTLKSMFKVKESATHTLTQDEVEYYKDYKNLKEQIDNLTLEINEKKNLLIRGMEDAEYGYIEGKKSPVITYKNVSARQRVSLTEIRDEAPNIYTELEERNLIKTGKPIRVFKLK